MSNTPHSQDERIYQSNTANTRIVDFSEKDSSMAESSLRASDSERGNPKSPLPCGGGLGGRVKSSDNPSLRTDFQNPRGTSPQLRSSDLAERKLSQLCEQNPQTTICHTEGAQATEVSQSQLKNRDISGLSPQYDKKIIDKTIDCHEFATFDKVANSRNDEIDSPSLAEGARGRVKSTLESVPKSSLDSNAKSSLQANLQNPRGNAKNITESHNEARQQNPLFIATYFLQTSGVVDKRGVGKILSLFSHLKTLKTIYHIFKKHDIKAVISVGGFSAAPASFGAILFGKPLFIHEQNAIKGRLNSLLSPFAKRVFSAFGENPIAYPTKSQARANARIRDEVKTIAFIGGSQGARTINALALQLSKTLLERGFSIIHQCGQNELKSTQEYYKKLGINYHLEEQFRANDSSKNAVELFGFSKDIISKLSRADICIGRAGASSVWENAALGLPMIYIPYPYAAGNHQVHNAGFFTSKELGFVVLDDKGEKSPQKLESMRGQILTHIDFFAKNNQKLKSISLTLIALAKENGAQKIIDEILQKLN
ncbi:UDP-N-acetylglucosamine--N-acetylmuramyl-(pentapeptide) pyrophosphoryl-undecaprenol N-acetylglucosamine transferase [Helicobacter sp. T3_23-1056]